MSATGPAIIIPWQDRGVPVRRKNADYVINHYLAMDVAEVFIGEYPVDDLPLNRSRLRAAGAEEALAEGADVLLFVDADCIIPPDQVVAALEKAAAGPGPVMIGTGHQQLTFEESRAIVKDGRPYTDFTFIKGRGRGGFFAMDAETYRAFGGWDEAYVGWGYEDLDAAWGASTVAPPRAVKGSWYMQLWHPAEGDSGTMPGQAFRAGTLPWMLLEANRRRYEWKVQNLLLPEEWAEWSGVPLPRSLVFHNQDREHQRLRVTQGA